MNTSLNVQVLFQPGRREEGDTVTSEWHFRESTSAFLGRISRSKPVIFLTTYTETIQEVAIDKWYI